MLTLKEVDVRHKRVLVRADYNVPMQDGHITSPARILESLPTLKYLIAQGAHIIVMSHLGRPKPGGWDAQYSLAPIAAYVAEHLGQEVPVVRNWREGVSVAAGEVVFLDNIRFEPGEESNDAMLGQALAGLADVFVLDAFSIAHRAQASVCAVATYANCACAGPLLMQEIQALNHALEHQESPRVAIVGGSKVSTKLAVLENVLMRVDQLIVGGGIANTFLAAQGYAVGASLYEPSMVAIAQDLLAKAAAANKQIIVPVDVRVATELTQTAATTVKRITEVGAEDKIFDLGPQTEVLIAECIMNAKTILWNGPLGAFEFTPFSYATKSMIQALGKTQAFTVAGGGDTVAALETLGPGVKLSYVSLSGGAFLEYIEGKVLPALAALSASAVHYQG